MYIRILYFIPKTCPVVKDEETRSNADMLQSLLLFLFGKEEKHLCSTDDFLAAHALRRNLMSAKTMEGFTGDKDD